MTHSSPTSVVANDDIEVLLPAEVDANRALTRWILPLEVVSALLMTVIVVLLLGGVHLGGDDRRRDRYAS
jgi:hypothetical protein